MDYNIHEFAKISNLSERTLRRRDRNGTLKAYRNERGEYVYSEKHALQFVAQSATIFCPHCQGEIKIFPI
jgi:DNA-binding transcriptional MerR regulator